MQLKKWKLALLLNLTNYEDKRSAQKHGTEIGLPSKYPISNPLLKSVLILLAKFKSRKK
jgi:hypothetical protein